MSHEAEVSAAVQARAAALARGDAAALERLLHSAFRWTSHRGEQFDRSGYIEANIGGSLVWHEQRLEQLTVDIVEATAVVHCVVVDDVTTPAGRASFRMPVTQTWVRTASGWECLAGHAGPRWDAP